MSGNKRSSFLPTLRPPRIRRKHLRKYSWLPDVFRVKGSIVRRITGPVLTVTIWSSLIAYAWSQGYKVSLANNVVPLLSVVVGLILVFRNSTSYDRYWEGRKSFAAMTSHVRNLSRQIWVNVAPPPDDSKGKTPVADLNPSQLHRKKVDTLHLSIAYVLAVKHYLRGEDGIQWDDLQSVLPPWFARISRKDTTPGSYAATRNNSLAPSNDGSVSGRTSPEFGTMKGDATKRIRVKRSKSKLATTPLLGRSVEFQVDPEEISIPLPLMIAHELTRLVFQFKRDGFLETVGPAGTNAMAAHVTGMVDQLTAMERVANTPIPISYGIHLKQCVTLYLFALPMTMVSDLGWLAVPITTIVAFTLMGIEGIADEIEMPFGLDQMDLPLERYCQDLKEEIDYMIDKLPEMGEGMYGYDDGEGDD